MAKSARREPSKQFSVAFPAALLEEIDTICAANFLSRTAWLVQAAKERLEKDRSQKTLEMIEKLSQH